MDTFKRLHLAAVALQAHANLLRVDARRWRYLIEAAPREGYWLAVMVGHAIVAVRVALLEALAGESVEIPTGPLVASLLFEREHGGVLRRVSELRAWAREAIAAGLPLTLADVDVDPREFLAALEGLDGDHLLSFRAVAPSSAPGAGPWLSLWGRAGADMTLVPSLVLEEDRDTRSSSAETSAPTMPPPPPPRVSARAWTPALRMGDGAAVVSP